MGNTFNRGGNIQKVAASFLKIHHHFPPETLFLNYRVRLCNWLCSRGPSIIILGGKFLNSVSLFLSTWRGKKAAATLPLALKYVRFYLIKLDCHNSSLRDIKDALRQKISNTKRLWDPKLSEKNDKWCWRCAGKEWTTRRTGGAWGEEIWKHVTQNSRTSSITPFFPHCVCTVAAVRFFFSIRYDTAISYWWHFHETPLYSNFLLPSLPVAYLTCHQLIFSKFFLHFLYPFNPSTRRFWFIKLSCNCDVWGIPLWIYPSVAKNRFLLDYLNLG